MAAFLRRDQRWRRVAIAAVLASVGNIVASELIASALVADLVIVLLLVAFLLFIARLRHGSGV